MDDFSHINGEGTLLRKVQLRLLDILIEIDRICRKHNIQYWIDFGTLLGAVRHGGFIPWDDDIDISMPSEDYHRFLEIAPKELPDNLFLQTKETDPSYRLLIDKVRDKNSLYITKHEDFTKDYNKGLYIDIFEAKPYPNANPKLQKFIMHWYQKTRHFFSVKQSVTLKNHLATIIFPIIKLNLDVVWGLINLGKKTNIGYAKQFNVYGNSYPHDIVFPLKDITFEGKTFLSPSNPDKYLSSIYGNYMKLPKKEQQHTHIIYVDLY
ncbi:MAG: LicD family protein [Bacteroidales bacterium]|nr:LicD family protein [Bacteroidales bacterium]